MAGFVTGQLVAFAVQGFQVVALTEQFVDFPLQGGLFGGCGDGEGYAAGSGGIEEP
ncbi:hypothetical protein D3C71_2242160 [compost metagenome]